MKCKNHNNNNLFHDKKNNSEFRIPNSDSEFKRLLLLFFITIIVVLPIVGCTSANMSAEGVRYFNQARYDQAQRAFTEALKREPNNPDIYFNLAETYHQSAKLSLTQGEIAKAQQQYDEANKYYRNCLAIDRNHLKANRGLAAMYIEIRQPQMAFEHIINWCKISPNLQDPKIELARLHHEWAQIMTAQGQKEISDSSIKKATELLQNVIANDPNNYRAWRAIGFIRENNGDRENAITAYQQSVLLNPNQNDLKNKLTTMGATPTGTLTTPAGTTTSTNNNTSSSLPNITGLGSIGYSTNENNTNSTPETTLIR
ncbi:MAG: tetratricopeptide repeat protein [Planctomycetaceae bacterium]|jgi:Tfp pilus assembly protein PilF|nr:tetratricopeptide repeat protein [Planctomycetaceae bacterium]